MKPDASAVFDCLDVPLLAEHRAEDYVPLVTKQVDDENPVDVEFAVKEHIYRQNLRAQCERDDDVIKRALASTSVPTMHRTTSGSDVTNSKDVFAARFSEVTHKAPMPKVLDLMRKEQQMGQKMAALTRARGWEIEQITHECESLLVQVDDDTDAHAFNLTKLNERLRKACVSYACQMDALASEQRTVYKSMVEAIAQGADLPCDSQDDDQPTDPIISRESSHLLSDSTIDESFTIYIGAQMKSMHNIRLTTANKLADICPSSLDSDIDARLQTAMSLYTRSLAGVVLLVSKEPHWHTRHNSNFSKACEATTELHFADLSKQLEAIANSTRSANDWRSNEKDCDGRALKENLGDLQCLVPGDVYCTTHSNLKRIQVAFHLVTDEQLSSNDISSRHSCFTGLRNIIRLCSRLGVHTIYIPLLLTESPNERTTVAWCVKRAEMVFKCVKGYLIEVCSSAGSSSPPPHYNINFVLPSGLTASIYQQVSGFLLPK